MTREVKIGLMIVGAFVSLIGGVLSARLVQTNVAPIEEPSAESEGKLGLTARGQEPEPPQPLGLSDPKSQPKSKSKPKPEPKPTPEPAPLPDPGDELEDFFNAAKSKKSNPEPNKTAPAPIPEPQTESTPKPIKPDADDEPSIPSVPLDDFPPSQAPEIEPKRAEQPRQPNPVQPVAAMEDDDELNLPPIPGVDVGSPTVPELPPIPEDPGEGTAPGVPDLPPIPEGSGDETAPGVPDLPPIPEDPGEGTAPGVPDLPVPTPDPEPFPTSPSEEPIPSVPPPEIEPLPTPDSMPTEPPEIPTPPTIADLAPIPDPMPTEPSEMPAPSSPEPVEAANIPPSPPGSEPKSDPEPIRMPEPDAVGEPKVVPINDPIQLEPVKPIDHRPETGTTSTDTPRTEDRPDSGTPRVRLEMPMPSRPSPNPEPNPDPIGQVAPRNPPSMTQPSNVEFYDEDIHRVRPNETWVSISSRYYNDPSYANALLRYNRGLPSGQSLGERPMINQELKVPPIWVLRKRYPDEVPNLPGDRTTTRTVSRPASLYSPAVESVSQEGNSGRFYIVTAERGESLHEIAARTLGSRQYFYVIRDLNPQVNPDAPVPAGTRLYMPPGARLPLN